jgi:biopolymer transport protein ExbB/TolQ
VRRARFKLCCQRWWRRLLRERNLAVSKFTRWVETIAYSPVVWGTFASLLFYTPIESGDWTNRLVVRYFAGHWVEYVTTTLFFVGLAAIVIKAWRIHLQFTIFGQPLFERGSVGGQPVSQAAGLLARLERLNRGWQQSYLIARLREALDYVHRKGSAQTLDDELKYLADLDVAKMHSSYALVRIVIWAVPILGFLGTVIGITDAVASLSPESLEESLPQVTSGLGVAFDTTALSLGLSMVLMFAQFFTERFENKLLSAVDARVSLELVGRFEELPGVSNDPQVYTLRKLAETMLQGTEALAQRQSEVWRSTIDAAHLQWQAVMAQTGQQLERSLVAALGKNLNDHAGALAAAEQAAAEQNRKHWAAVQQSLVQNAEALVASQERIVEQGEVLGRVVEATGQVARLEAELNKNLAALAGTRNFEETVVSLAAAIQLLTTRLAQPGDVPRVELKPARPGKAA